jgi:hypothetical protein
MPQDQTRKEAYEQEAGEKKAHRAEDRADRIVNDAALRADSHTGQQGLMATDGALIEGVEIKALYDLLPDFHRDELRRILIVPRETRLPQGGVYCDARFRERGELVAHGEEEVHDELLVPKNAVDAEIWNKLLRR